VVACLNSFNLERDMKIVLVIYHLLAFLTLMVFAALQYNDPDAMFWGGFYATCALIPLLAVFGLRNWILYALCAIYAIVVISPAINGFFEYMRSTDSLVYGMGMNSDKPYIEEAREFLGTLVAAGLITTSMLLRK
jgi:hypothetical protein